MDLYFSMNLSNDLMLCISPLSDKRAFAAGPEVQRNPVGYFLYQTSNSGAHEDIAVLARLASEDAAIRLSRILNME